MRRSSAILRYLVLMALVPVGLQVALGAPASAATGPGQMFASPTMVLEGSTSDTLTFTYLATKPGLSKGTLSLKVPGGWTAPQKKKPTKPGYVSSSVGTVAVSTGRITVTNVKLCGTCSATITYGDASAPSVTGPFSFAARAAASGDQMRRLASSPSVLVGALPAAPTITSVTPGVEELTVAFTPVTASPPVTGYMVTCGAQSVSTTSAAPVTVDALTAGTPVACTVDAENDFGSGPSSSPVSDIPQPQVPGSPTVTSVVAADGELTVNYTPSSVGGGPTTSYTATCGSQAITVDASTLSATVAGLTNGTEYQCSLIASDAGGSSGPSPWEGEPGPTSTGLNGFTATDNFNRSDGSLGAGWTDMTDGGLAISSQEVVGTNGTFSGEIRTGESFASDQSSQIEVTSTQLSGGEWIGPAVRAKNGGQSLYLGLYFWNNGDPELMLFKRIAGNWTQLGAAYQSGALVAGTQLTLAVSGSTLTFSQNGVVRITATDTSLTSGSPAIMAYGSPQGDNWVGVSGGGTSGSYTVGGSVSGLSGTVVLEDNGTDDLSLSANGPFTFDTALTTGSPYTVSVKTNPTGQTCAVANGSDTIGSADVTNVTVTCMTTGQNGFTIQYESTDASGIEYYSFSSADDGYGNQTLRVLPPSHPAVGVAHNFLYVLPVEAGLGTTFGDGLATMQALDAQDQYDLTIIEPTFSTAPWYADNPNDANLQYETFMTNDLEPWVAANLATTGQEQNWLIGFSKSGIGAQDLLLKHPSTFQLAASWDFPADMSSYDEYGSASAYGTDANFQANYRLTQAFVDSHKAPFLTSNRIWIGGYNAFQTDIADYDALLSAEGIPHTTGPSVPIEHRWDSGWVPEALAALAQDSIQQH